MEIIKTICSLLIAINLVAPPCFASKLPVADKFRLQGLSDLTGKLPDKNISALETLNKDVEMQYNYHNRIKKDLEWAAYINKMEVTFIEGSIELTKNVPLIGGAVAVAGEVLRDAVDVVQSAAVENLDHSMAEVRKIHLAKYLNEKGREPLIELLDEFQGNPDKALARLADTTGLLDSGTYNNMDADGKIAYQKMTIEKLAHDVAIHEIETQAKVENLDQVAKNAEVKADEAIKLSREVYKATMSEMGGMLSATEDLRKSMTKFEEQAKSFQKQDSANHKKSHGYLNRMEDYTFEKMSPEDQLSALNNGWRPDLKGQERDQNILGLKVQVKKRETNQAITKGLSQMTSDLQNLAIIANNLGVNPKVGKVIGKAAEIGGSALKVMTSLTSGNILGAISAVTSLFAKKPDIGAQRHEQIMESFGKVFENQEKIMKKLVKLREGQRKIMENQKMIYESIVALSKQSHAQYISLGDQIVDVRNIILRGQEVVMANYTHDIDSCSAFLPKDHSRQTIPLAQLDYDEFSAHIRDRGHTFRDCMSGLDQMLPTLSNLGELEPYFQLASYQFQNADATKADINIDAIYTPLMNYHKINATGENSALESSVYQLSNPINIAVVLELADTLISLHPYFQLLNDPNSRGMALHNPQAISLDDLKNIGPVPRTTGKQHLEALLNIIKAAITQVHMMSGVGVLQQIQDDLFSPESERQIRAGNALINNPQLQKNILFASIQNQMNITGTNINAYAQVYKSNNPLVITELLTGPQWNVVKDENGLWKAKLDLTIQGYTASSEPQKQVIEIYLPNSAQVESKQLSHQPELKFLMETKDLIINEIMQYEIWSDKEDWFKKLYLDAI